MTLEEWLNQNRIQHEIVGRDILHVPGWGDALIQDMEDKDDCLLKITDDGEVRFNCADSPQGLVEDGVGYVVLPFGDNWFYIDLNSEFKLEILKYVGQRMPTERDEEIVNLGCHDAYELLNGSFLPKDWVKKAKWYGHKAIGICNRNTMASLYNLQKECAAAGLTPVFGYTLRCRVDEDHAFDAKVFVQTQEGYQNLLRIQKRIMVDNVLTQEIELEELLKRGKGNVLVLGKLSPLQIDFSSFMVNHFKDHFDAVYYQLDLNEYKAERIDVQVLHAFKEFWDLGCSEQHNIQTVLLPDCYYLDQDDAKCKIIVNKIAEGASHEQSDQQYFKDVDELYATVRDIFEDMDYLSPMWKNARQNALKIASGAVARLDNTRNFMPKYDMTSEEAEKYGTRHNMFNQLLQEGLDRLAPKEQYDIYKKRMDYEKYVIESTDNVDYLLVQWDSTNWCRRNNIYVGCGRGSAAGSLLLFLLGITLVDPIRYNLLFERFLLPERAGLYSSQVSIIGEKIESQDVVEIELENGSKVRFDIDAKFLIKREGYEEPIQVYADELREGDDILFDNRDSVFTINEI